MRTIGIISDSEKEIEDISVTKCKNVYMILWIFSQRDTTEISLGLPWTFRETNSVKSFPDLPKERDAWLRLN